MKNKIFITKIVILAINIIGISFGYHDGKFNDLYICGFELIYNTAIAVYLGTLGMKGLRSSWIIVFGLMIVIGAFDTFMIDNFTEQYQTLNLDSSLMIIGNCFLVLFVFMLIMNVVLIIRDKKFENRH